MSTPLREGPTNGEFYWEINGFPGKAKGVLLKRVIRVVLQF